MDVPSGHLVPSPILGLANAPIVETKFLELAMSLLDFSPRIPLGTFSIFLQQRNTIPWLRIRSFNKGGNSMNTNTILQKRRELHEYENDGIIDGIIMHYMTKERIQNNLPYYFIKCRNLFLALVKVWRNCMTCTIYHLSGDMCVK